MRRGEGSLPSTTALRSMPASAPAAGEGCSPRAADWLGSPCLDRLVSRVASHQGVPASEWPDLIQETRIALWQAGLELPVSAALVGSIARHKAIDLVRKLARRRARRRAAGLLAANPDSDAELPHLLSLRIAALPPRLREFYELHYTLGLSEREIARAWGMCRASVRWLDRRFRARLVGAGDRRPESEPVWAVRIRGASVGRLRSTARA
jgi:DNA-directed RNA polymerase specialized sigma24 family protein